MGRPIYIRKFRRETAIIQTPRGRRIFRSVCVKPWIDAEWETNAEKKEECSVIWQAENSVYEEMK